MAIFRIENFPHGPFKSGHLGERGIVLVGWGLDQKSAQVLAKVADGEVLGGVSVDVG
jgi:hypothetical protein